MRILGLDPGLRHTGWGVIEAGHGRLRHVGNGAVHSAAGPALAPRLAELYRGLSAVLARFLPDVAAVEETFVNRNPGSTLKLGQARGVVLLAPALAGVPVAEYAPNLVKKTIVGTGHAEKAQIAMMVRTLLPAAGPLDPDAADALAVALCHAQHAAFAARATPAGQAQ
ncbi:MAG: crossover junction endodeoxyribonuclease RuvC [Alphaproteobacteria bacterium]|nr:crossover junction endodeoxyribonuclease RuvC [Alphaproteobacteria bacterium]